MPIIFHTDAYYITRFFSKYNCRYNCTNKHSPDFNKEKGSEVYYLPLSIKL